MTVAQLIKKLNKMPQDAIVTISNDDLYLNGEYIATSVETFDGETVEICTDYESWIGDDGK